MTGFAPRHLPVLFLGLPVTYAYNGGRTFGFRMPVTGISRIEVVRGPGSAVFGADAFAGTINVFTREAEESRGTTTGVRAGSFASYDAWLQHGGSAGPWESAFSLTYRESAGDPQRIVHSDVQSQIDAGLHPLFAIPPASLATPGLLSTRYRIVDAGLALQQSGWTIRLYGFLQDDAGVGCGATQVVDPAGRIDTGLLLTDLVYQTASIRDWDLSLRLSSLYLHEDNFFQMFPPGALVPIGADGNINPNAPVGFGLYTQGLVGNPIATDRQAALESVALYSGVDDHLLRFGAGLRHLKEEAESYQNFGRGVLDPATLFAGGPVAPVDGRLTHLTGGPGIFLLGQERTLWYGFLQDEWALTRAWELIGGVRYDHYSDFGDTTNPRLAVIWEGRPDLTTKLLYGRAFRTPSFAEQHNQNNPSTQGNPEVRPETIDTLEMAFDYQPSPRLRAVFNVFAYWAEDLIDFLPDPAPATSRTARNARDQRGSGWELEADWQLTAALRLRSNLAYQRSKNADTGEIVADAPALKAHAELLWAFQPDWSLDGQLYWVADRERDPDGADPSSPADDDLRPDIPNATWVNLALRCKDIAHHWDAALVVRNLFDADVREPSDGGIPDDYPMPGRSLYGEVRYRF
ncbi:MAG: TonB-dependent receptor [Thermodesulfobacteriota bacterium]